MDSYKGISKVVLICFLGALNWVVAQQSTRDSLYKVVQQLPNDTSRIFPLYELGLAMEEISIDSATQYYNQAKILSDRFNHIKGKIRYASIYSGILNEQGRLEESYKLSLEGLKLTEENGLYYEMAKTCNNLGNVLNYMGDFNGSMNYFLRAAAIFEKINRKEHLNIIYQNIASVYLSLNNFEKSIEYTKLSISLSEQKGDSNSVSNALTNMGGALVSLGRYEEGLKAFVRCLRISESVGNIYAQNMAHLGLGNLYTQVKDFDKALEFLNKALIVSRVQGYTNNLANCLNALATVHFEKNNLPLADKYATEAVAINEQYKVFNNLRQQYKLMAEIKSGLGQYSKAFDYLNKYLNLNDSLANVETKRSVDELEKKYQTAEKDKQITEKNLRLAENQLQIEKNKERIQKINTWLVVAGAAIVILVLILLLVYFISSQRQKLQKQKLLAMQQEQEVIRLKATLEGQHQERQRIAREMHDEIGSGLTTILFLGNSLGTENEKSKKIADTSRILINQMNEIIWSMNTQQDTLEDLVSYIRHNIGEMLNAAQIDYQIDGVDQIGDQKISGMQRRNLYLVVKEAVHNIIKHAGATEVKILFNFGHGVNITIADNGKGIEADGNPFGNGMKNMKYRMEQIGGTWKVMSSRPFIIELDLKKDWMV